MRSARKSTEIKNQLTPTLTPENYIQKTPRRGCFQVVGTSPHKIRKTYRHWIKEATESAGRSPAASLDQTRAGRGWQP